MYIRLSDSHYPMTEVGIRAENPDTIFASPFSPDGYDWVFPTPQPEHNTITQTVREIDPVFSEIKGFWEQAWEVVDRYATQAEADAAVAADLTQKVSAAVVLIDLNTDSIYGSVLGNRAQEYTLAEADATAYRDAGYTGTVPASVQCWATAKSWTATQAADDIFATATAWRSAQAAIRAQRLASKEAVRAAGSVAGITAAMATWAGFVVTIRGQLGI